MFLTYLRRELTNRRKQTVIIDPNTGLMVGEREISYATDWDIPSGTVAKWTSVTTTLEDSAPSEAGR